MPNNNETIAAIIAEMKRENRPYGISLEHLHYYADRLEAAADREREMAKGLSKKLDENRAITGNAAAIRDALKAVFEKLLECAPTAEQEWPKLVERARTALERKPEENYGNAVALREALEQAKRDHWFDMSPDLRNKIFAALSAPPEPPSNAAALHAVVERCRDYLADLLTAILAIKSVNDRRPHDADGYEINDIIEEALALEKGKEADNG